MRKRSDIINSIPRNGGVCSPIAENSIKTMTAEYLYLTVCLPSAELLNQQQLFQKLHGCCTIGLAWELQYFSKRIDQHPVFMHLVEHGFAEKQQRCQISWYPG